MPLIALVVAFLAVALAMASIDPFVTQPILAAGGAALTLAALTARRARSVLLELAHQHWTAMAGFFALAMVIAWRAGLFAGSDGAPGVLAATFGIGLAALATAAISHAYGRNAVAVSLLVTAIPLAFAALLTHGLDLNGPLGRVAPAIDAPGLIAGFGVLALIALHVAADELRRRPSPGEPALPPLARRLFAPIATLMTSFAILTLAGAPAALAAAGGGALVFAAALWPRAKKSRVGAAIIPGLAFVSVGAAALAVVSAAISGGGPMLAPRSEPGALHWFAENGIVSAILLAATLGALAFQLFMTKDRRRTPSRGAPLLLAGAAFALGASLFETGFLTPSAGAAFAVLVGLAASYYDQSSKAAPAA